MRDLIHKLSQNRSKIWNFIGTVSAIIGLVCFALSSTFKRLIGKWDFHHFLIYLVVGLMILCFALLAKRIRIPERLQSHVIALSFVLICLISVLHEKFVKGKPDKLITASYASFALTSLSMSRKFELGFETGLFSFFLEMCMVELIKMSWKFFPVVLVFYVLIVLRHYLDSQSESGRNGYLPFRVDPANRAANGHINRQMQHHLRMGIVSGESRLSRDNQQNNKEEEETRSSLNFQAMHHSPRIGEVSGESIARDHEQNSEEPSNQEDNVSSRTNMLTPGNGLMQSSSESGSISGTPPPSPRMGEVSGESVLSRDNRQENEEETRASLSFQAESSNQEDKVSSGNTNNTVLIEKGKMQISLRRRIRRVEKEEEITSQWISELHHPSALHMFDQIIDASGGKQIVVFLNYDGTLVPIVDDPDRAFMSLAMRKTVRNLARCFPTAIVSGRCRDKVYNFVRLAELYYAGSHGMDIKGPTKISKHNKYSKAVLFQPACEFLPMIDKAYQLLVEKTRSTPGAMVENNKFCISVHYRCVDEKNWSELANQVMSVLKEYPKLRLTHGRKVYEILPSIKWDKGEALEFLLEILGFANCTDVSPVYIGDARSDEDAFKKLRERGQGCGILVSKFPKDTSASYSLQEPSQVMDFLQRLVEWKKVSS